MGINRLSQDVLTVDLPQEPELGSEQEFFKKSIKEECRL
jgi:hypothetical protein